jgi:hypothetical protein
MVAVFQPTGYMGSWSGGRGESSKKNEMHVVQTHRNRADLTVDIVESTFCFKEGLLHS